MKIGLQEPDWEYIGACLARSDDHAQSQLLKAFVKECLTWGTHLQVETQLAAVNGKLTKEEIEVLSMITYKEKE